MPTYDYKCDACGHTFEMFQSIKADPIKQCPKCKKNKVKRLIGMGAGLIFKGSGFYITDYRDKSYGDKAKADAAPSTETKSDAKTETKSNAKSETKTESKSETKSESKPAASESKPAKPDSGSSSSSKKK